jgi:hypothetical protein
LLKREEVISTTRTLQGVSYPEYPSLSKTVEARGKKKKSKPQLQGHKGLKP